jgi:hypothetical protein
VADFATRRRNSPIALTFDGAWPTAARRVDLEVDFIGRDAFIRKRATGGAKVLDDSEGCSRYPAMPGRTAAQRRLITITAMQAA